MVKRYGKEIRTVDIYIENIDKLKEEGKEPKAAINDMLAANFAIKSIAFPTLVVTPQIQVMGDKKAILVSDIKAQEVAPIVAKGRKLFCTLDKKENCDHTAVVYASHIDLAAKLIEES